MIFLIDDKHHRQNDYGWDKAKFEKHIGVIKPIYNMEDLVEQKNEIFDEGNLVIYHESFLDHTNQKSKAVSLRDTLQNHAKDQPEFSLVLFSGSKDTRVIEGNIAYCPVSTIYGNLELFCEESKDKTQNLDLFLFGKNKGVEAELTKLLDKANLKNSLPPAVIENGKNLFFRTSKKNLQNPIENAVEKPLFNVELTDEKLDEKINEWLTSEKFDNIFIPLCFGSTLSDFNGLRLACHIRCTKTINQTSNLFIYSFLGIERILDNRYFNILKTKNVEFVDYDKREFERVALIPKSELEIDELPQEMAKLKLDIPRNYEDNHSVINEWAIDQWARTIGCDETDEIEKVFQNVQSKLYFKYLRTISPVLANDIIPQEKLVINYEGNPKVLLIDDQANKGWDEIFAYILSDLNEIYIDCLRDNFKTLSQEEVIEKSIDKIKEDDIDVVILDFRLTPLDLEETNIEEVSSIQILKRIKKENPGIQVIIFSATNKIWNLQSIQNAGADGFIMKEVGQNTDQTISNLVNVLTASFQKASWLKPIWNKTKASMNHLEIQRRSHKLDGNFTGAISTFLELGFNSLYTNKKSFSFESAFMYYFLILEAISKQLVDEDSPHEVMYTNKFNEIKKGYKFQFRTNYEFLKDFEGNDFMCVSKGDDLISGNKRIPYNAKFHNLISYAGITGVDPISIVKLRNDFNHPNLVENQRTAFIEKEDVKRIFTICEELVRKL